MLGSDASFQFGEGKPIIRNEVAQVRTHWTLSALVWFASSMSYVSVTHCSFMRKGNTSIDYKSLDQMGLFKVPMYDPDHELLGCISYDSRSEWDRNFKLARAVAVLLLFSLSLVTILQTLSVLFLLQQRRKLIIHWIGRCLILSSLLFNTLLFIVFGGEECSDEDMKCPPGPGAILAILNEFVLLVAAILYLMVPPPANPFFVRFSSVPTHGPFRDGSTFSVPETVKAKNAFKKKVDKTPKSGKARATSEDPACTGALVVPNDGHQGNHRDGSSSSTLRMEDIDEEAPKHTQKYRAPSHSIKY